MFILPTFHQTFILKRNVGIHRALLDIKVVAWSERNMEWGYEDHVSARCTGSDVNMNLSPSFIFFGKMEVCTS